MTQEEQKKLESLAKDLVHLEQLNCGYVTFKNVGQPFLADYEYEELLRLGRDAKITSLKNKIKALLS